MTSFGGFLVAASRSARKCRRREIPSRVTGTGLHEDSPQGQRPTRITTWLSKAPAVRKSASENGDAGDRPLARSGRATKTPSFLNDCIRFAIEGTRTLTRDELKKMDKAIAKEKFVDWIQDYCYLVVAHAQESQTFAEAMSGEYAMQWCGSADSEIKSHLDNGTWE